MSGAGATPFLTLTSVVRRMLLSRSRVAIAVVLGLLLGLAAVALRVGGNGRDVANLLTNGVFLLAVPLVALVVAVAALGEPRDDGTLVYLWLKPMPRWQVAVGSCLATWLAVVPLTLGIGLVVAIGGARTDLILAVVVTTVLASLAYGTVFVALGLRTTRSLIAGLMFVLLWEGFFASLSSGVATFTLRRWTTGLFSNLADVRAPLAPVTTTKAVIVLVAVTVAGLLLTTRWLTTRDVP